MPFGFLVELQRKVRLSAPTLCELITLQFLEAPMSSSSDIPAYGLQGSFGPTIAKLMHTYNTAPPLDEIARAQAELNQVKDIMVQNVEQILNRGERIELLVDKTDVMAGQATAFRRGARIVRRQMWWKNTRVLGLSILVGLVRLFLRHMTLCES
jgi:vesicle-associated membrane protein 7